jgi:hypothetical protein
MLSQSDSPDVRAVAAACAEADTAAALPDAGDDAVRAKQKADRALARVYNGSKGNLRFAARALREDAPAEVQRVHDAMLAIASLRQEVTQLLPSDIDIDPFACDPSRVTFPLLALCPRICSREDVVQLADRGIVIYVADAIAFPHPAFVVEALQRRQVQSYGLSHDERVFVVDVDVGRARARAVGESLVARSLSSTLLPALRRDAVWSDDAAGNAARAVIAETASEIARGGTKLDLCRGRLLFRTDDILYSPDDRRQRPVVVQYGEWIEPTHDVFGFDRLCFLRRVETSAPRFLRVIPLGTTRVLTDVIVIGVQVKLGKPKVEESTTSDISLPAAVYKMEGGWVGGVEAQSRRAANENSWADGDRLVLNEAAHVGLRARLDSPSRIHGVFCVVTNHHVNDDTALAWETRMASIAADGARGTCGGGVVLHGDRMADMWLPAMRAFAASVGSRHWGGSRFSPASVSVETRLSLVRGDGSLGAVAVDVALMEWESVMERCGLSRWLAFPFFAQYSAGPRQLHSVISSGLMTREAVHAALNIPSLTIVDVNLVILAVRPPIA